MDDSTDPPSHVPAWSANSGLPTPAPWWRAPGWLAACLALSLLLVHEYADPDLWGHVRFGQDFWVEGLPRFATHTFTAPEQPWINHENVCEIVFAWLVTTGGGEGGLLMLLQWLFALTVVALIIDSNLRRQVSALPLLLVATLALSIAGVGWTLRPQLFTYTFFAIQIYCCHHFFDPVTKTNVRPWIWLYVLPFLMLLWTNTHGGFVAGLAILLLHLGCEGLASWLEQGRSATPVLARLAVLGGLCMLVTFVNPYGWGLHRWLIGSLPYPRPEIGEWAALSWTSSFALPFVLLATLAAAGWWRGSRHWPHAVVLAAAAYQGMAHYRHLPFFALLVAFWLPPWWKRAWAGNDNSPTIDPPTAESWRWLAALTRGPFAWVLVLLLLSANLWRLRAVWVDRGNYPLAAVAYLAEEKIGGKMVVFFDWSQYVIAALAPTVTVSFDGRFDTCYPYTQVDMHFDFLCTSTAPRWRCPASPKEIDSMRTLRFADPDLVLLDRRQGHPVTIMNQQPEWVCLYRDSLAQLWGRKNIFDDPTHARYVPPSRRRLDDAPQSGWARWPAFP